MAWKYNVFTQELDYAGSGMTTGAADLRYLRLDCSNDPLTEALRITPASGTDALICDEDVTIKAGKKLYFDGD